MSHRKIHRTVGSCTTIGKGTRSAVAHAIVLDNLGPRDMRVPAARKKVRFCLELDEVRRGYVGEAACGWVVNDNNNGVQEVIRCDASLGGSNTE